MQAEQPLAYNLVLYADDIHYHNNFFFLIDIAGAVLPDVHLPSFVSTEFLIKYLFSFDFAKYPRIVYRVAPQKNGTVDFFFVLCSHQQFFFTLLG